MKVWITKYALTEGIFEVEAEPSFTPGWVRYDRNGMSNGISRRFWFESRELAVASAERERDKKIKSVENQLRKLKELTFKAPTT